MYLYDHVEIHESFLVFGGDAFIDTNRKVFELYCNISFHVFVFVREAMLEAHFQTISVERE